MLKVIIFNSIVIYASLVAFMRLLGKRTLGQLEPSELVVTILISDVAATPICDPEKPVWFGLVPVAMLFGLEYILSIAAARSVRLRGVLAGKPSLLMVFLAFSKFSRYSS